MILHLESRLTVKGNKDTKAAALQKSSYSTGIGHRIRIKRKGRQNSSLLVGG